ncbi:MAG TPA: hypothetical protein VEJ42_11055 [Streptosporangiaceae bacterium]|nr:hypothetical protein [Streptosporangiaceae bacterium]
MKPHRRIPCILGSCALVVLAVTVTACGSSPSTSKPSPKASASSSAVSEITANWEAFFSPSSSLSQRINLLQDGPQVQAAVQSLLGSSFASEASAKVTKVTLTSPTQATVIYNILVGGTPELKNQTGTAVYENGTWKVGVASFCNLAALANGGKTTGLPAPCQSP